MNRINKINDNNLNGNAKANKNAYGDANTNGKGNINEEKYCSQCEELLSIKENEILDDFLERLTNFTYNN